MHGREGRENSGGGVVDLKRDRKEGRRRQWRVKREKEGRKDFSPFTRSHVMI